MSVAGYACLVLLTKAMAMAACRESPTAHTCDTAMCRGTPVRCSLNRANAVGMGIAIEDGRNSVLPIGGRPVGAESFTPSASMSLRRQTCVGFRLSGHGPGCAVAHFSHDGGCADSADV